jgi:ABC-type nitrate/sulfonate/bicarbonate transport system substrate-binding protein
LALVLGTVVRKLLVQQSWINDSEFIGYYVAEAEGFYGADGLEVTHIPGHAGLTPERMLLEGTADIALCAPESLAATIRETGAKFRVIAAQFQKSPLGIVSRADDPVNDLRALAGRTLSVPDLNRTMVLELFAHAGLSPDDVSIVPYAHDPVPLIERRIAGLVDFVVDPQYRLTEAGVVGHTILLFDHGAPLPNNLAVVTDETFAGRRSDLRRWVTASRRGWRENYRDPAFYPRRLRGEPLVETRTLAHETYANEAFRPLVEAPNGIMSISDGLIEGTLAYLDRVSLPLDRSVFAPLG